MPRVSLHITTFFNTQNFAVSKILVNTHTHTHTHNIRTANPCARKYNIFF